MQNEKVCGVRRAACESPTHKRKQLGAGDGGSAAF